MWVQAVGVAVTELSAGFLGFGFGAVLLGLGTAMLYPTLLAAITLLSDVIAAVRMNETLVAEKA